MDSQLFVNAIELALETPDETLLERLGAILLEAHAAANAPIQAEHISAVVETDDAADGIEQTKS